MAAVIIILGSVSHANSMLTLIASKQYAATVPSSVACYNHFYLEV
jgi:hypothetical protein